MTEVVEQNKDLLERHAEKNLPTSELADALIEVADSH